MRDLVSNSLSELAHLCHGLIHSYLLTKLAYCKLILAGRIMASKETRFKSKISIQCGYCKVSMRNDRLSEHTCQQHPGLPTKECGQTSLTDILSWKRPHDREDEGETNTTAKKKKTDGPNETQSGSSAATSESPSRTDCH